jgi:hypothetical protein
VLELRGVEECSDHALHDADLRSNAEREKHREEQEAPGLGKGELANESGCMHLACNPCHSISKNNLATEHTLHQNTYYIGTHIGTEHSLHQVEYHLLGTHAIALVSITLHLNTHCIRTHIGTEHRLQQNSDYNRTHTASEHTLEQNTHCIRTHIASEHSLHLNKHCIRIHTTSEYTLHQNTPCNRIHAASENTLEQNTHSIGKHNFAPEHIMSHQCGLAITSYNCVG